MSSKNAHGRFLGRQAFIVGLAGRNVRSSKTPVPRQSYQASHRSCIATSTTFCQPTPANRTPLSTQHVWPSGFSSCWSDDLELAARWTQEIQRVTLTVSNSSLKQSCSVSTSVTSALEVNFNNMRYINLHFAYLLTLLTYLRTDRQTPRRWQRRAKHSAVARKNTSWVISFIGIALWCKTTATNLFLNTKAFILI